MSAILTWLAGTRLGRWVIGLGAVLMAALALAGIAWRKGEKSGAAKGEAEAEKAKADAAEQRATETIAEQKAQQAAVQTASEVHDEIQKLPDAPAQQVATADPATAAGHLRDDGWVRDDAIDANGH